MNVRNLEENPSYIDVIGCNYYVHNQWVYGGEFIERIASAIPAAKRNMLAEV